MPVPSNVESVHKDHLRQLSERPNTTVLTVEHDVKNDPWSAARLRTVMESITTRTLATPAEVNDFALRKKLLSEDVYGGVPASEVLSFQRQHPKMYWLLTDRTIMCDKKSREVITGMLFIRDEIERGNVAEGEEADAMATRTVITAMQTPPP